MKTTQHEVTAKNMEPTRSIPVRIPATDIYETDRDIALLVDMPGVSEKGLEVTLENTTLTLIGRGSVSEPASHELWHREFGPAEYRRSFTLNEEIDREKITAKIKAGQVRITLPKASKTQPRRIAVDN